MVEGLKQGPAILLPAEALEALEALGIKALEDVTILAVLRPSPSAWSARALAMSIFGRSALVGEPTVPSP